MDGGGAQPEARGNVLFAVPFEKAGKRLPEAGGQRVNAGFERADERSANQPAQLDMKEAHQALLAWGELPLSDCAVNKKQAHGPLLRCLIDRAELVIATGQLAVLVEAGGAIPVAIEDQIYVMNANGTGVMRLTNHPGIDGFAAWSPTGTQIAFTSTRHGNSEIYSMNANGTGAVARLTTNSATDSEPAWGTNGKILFSSTRHGNFEIHSMNANGTGVTRLTNHPQWDTSPHW